jgi:hypothetical protein
MLVMIRMAGHFCIIIGVVFVATLLFGYFLGFVGNAGGPFYVALLIGLFQFPVKSAVGTALFASAITVMIATIGHMRMKNVNLRLGLIMGGFGSMGALAGAYLSINMLSEIFLKPIFAMALFILAVTGILKNAKWKNNGNKIRKNQGLLDSDRIEIDQMSLRTKIISAIIGFLTGVISGAFGVSGSTPLSALTRTFFNYKVRVCFGSSYLAASIATLFGCIPYISLDQVNWTFSAVLASGTGIGIYLSIGRVNKISERILMLTMYGFLICMSIFTIFK